MYISKVYLGQLNLFSFQMRIKQHVISFFLLFFFLEKNCLEHKLAERRSRRRELENLLDIGKRNVHVDL